MSTDDMKLEVLRWIRDTNGRGPVPGEWLVSAEALAACQRALRSTKRANLWRYGDGARVLTDAGHAALAEPIDLMDALKKSLAKAKGE